MKKFLLFLAATAVYGVTFGQVLLDEKFTDGIPATWTVQQTNASETWKIGSGNPGFSGNFAVVDYDDNLLQQDEWLITPSLNLTELETAILSFKISTSYYWAVTMDTYDIFAKISTDDGATWTELWSESDLGNFTNWNIYEVELDLADYLDETNVKIAFQYYGLDGAAVYLDNVRVGEEEEDSIYCDTINLDCSIEQINSVSFAGISNLNTGCGLPEDNDFTSMVANVEKGQTYPIVLDIFADSTFPEDHVFFFIDWNQNGSFEDEGEVYSVVSYTGESGEYSIDVEVPEDALIGETRMRVGIVYYYDPGFEPISCPDPLDIYYGEYEDYTVNVSEMGVADVSKSAVALYPNPVLDTFKLNLPKTYNLANLNVQVTDTSGKVVKTFKSSHEYNVSDLSSGVYVVKVTDGVNSTSTKIVKK